MHPFLNTRVALRGQILRPVVAHGGDKGLGDCTGCAGLDDGHLCDGLPCTPTSTEGLGRPVVWVPVNPSGRRATPLCPSCGFDPNEVEVGYQPERCPCCGERPAGQAA